MVRWTIGLPLIAGVGTWLLYTSLALGWVGWHRPQLTRRGHLKPSSTRDDAWPRIIDEIRLLVSLAGRSAPQALIDAGRRAPPSLEAAFTRAEAAWLRTADLDQMTAALISDDDDRTAEMLGELLVVENEASWAHLDDGLASLRDRALANGRRRREAAGRAREARSTRMLIPITTAACTVGVDASAATWNVTGPLIACLAVATGCWVWSGHLVKAPRR